VSEQLAAAGRDGTATAVHRHTLQNGLRVLVLPQPHLQGATLSVFVKVGPRYESEATNGISHFLEHMLFRGTRRYASPYELTFASEALGGMIDAATYADFTQFQLSVPRERAREALTLLADLLEAPRFLDMELEKKIVREEILADLDAEGKEVDAENLSRLVMFPGHPLGFKITGEVSHVDGFTVDDLRAHLGRHYVAANMAVVATGAVDPREVLDATEAAFGGFGRGRVTLLEAPPPPRHATHLAFIDHDASQTDVRLCFRAFGADDPDFMALKLLTRVLDDGMSTRLHRRMTDDSGLAYDVFASLDPYEEIGVLELGASVEHEKAPEVLRVALALLTELRDGEITKAELDKAKDRYLWSLRRIVDSPEDLAMYAGTQAVFGRDVDLAGLRAAAEAVGAAEMQRALGRVLHAHNTHVVMVGKLKKPVQKAVRKVFDAFARTHP
jgi:predicted Zn-dependent peptidase